MRILGLDVGDKKIGCALSDPDGKIAFGLNTIKTKEVDKSLSEILSKYSVEMIVCGLPLTMNGKIEKQAEKVLAFLQKLKKITTLPIALWDERLSTKEAERVLEDLSLNKRRKVVDKLASQLILQGFLDRKNITENG